MTVGEGGVAAQAAELRGTEPRGTGTAAIAGAVRGFVPFLATGDVVPDVEPLSEAVRRGELSR